MSEIVRYIILKFQTFLETEEYVRVEKVQTGSRNKLRFCDLGSKAVK